jgi:hypothetical protein
MNKSDLNRWAKPTLQRKSAMVVKDGVVCMICISAGVKSVGFVA